MAGSVTTFLTKAFVVGLLIFLFVFLFGLGGGFKTAFNIGQTVAKIPVWFWVALGTLWLVNQMRN
jgi:hypothetical protein